MQVPIQDLGAVDQDPTVVRGPAMMLATQTRLKADLGSVLDILSSLPPPHQPASTPPLTQNLLTELVLSDTAKPLDFIFILYFYFHIFYLSYVAKVGPVEFYTDFEKRSGPLFFVLLFHFY